MERNKGGKKKTPSNTQPGQCSKTPCLQKIQNKKSSQASWWCMPAVLATKEAEVGGSLGSRSSRLQVSHDWTTAP